MKNPTSVVHLSPATGSAREHERESWARSRARQAQASLERAKAMEGHVQVGGHATVMWLP
jgi:hypothetical protein